MRLINKISYYIAFAIMFLLAGYSYLLSTHTTIYIQHYLLVIAFVLFIIAKSKKGKIRISTNGLMFLYYWLILLIFVLAGINRNAVVSLRITVCVLIWFLFSKDISWIGIMEKVVGFFTGTNVIGTLFFFIFPQLYTIMIQLYGIVPSGTSYGRAGYRAGFADHYSQNGIYLSILLILLVSRLLCNPDGRLDGKYDKKTIISIAFTLFALLLTGKRAVLVFSVMAIMFTFLITKKNKTRTVFKIIAIGVVIIIALAYAASKIPEISYVFDRMMNIGDDFSSLTRISMLRLAFKKFLENPIFGNGFGSYGYYFAQSSEYNMGTILRLNAHNVYAQMLCETGVVGTAFYILAIGKGLSNTIKAIRDLPKDVDKKIRSSIFFSLTIQLFYVLYSFTGNCLFDIVFYYYFAAIMVLVSVAKRYR